MTTGLKMENINDNKVIWIADSGESANITNRLEGTTNLQPANGVSKVGNGSEVKVWHKETFNGEIRDQNGEKKKVKIEDVLVVFDFASNLFSVTKAIEKE